jgi:hypothetical protein
MVRAEGRSLSPQRFMNRTLSKEGLGFRRDSVYARNCSRDSFARGRMGKSKERFGVDVLSKSKDWFTKGFKATRTPRPFR